MAQQAMRVHANAAMPPSKMAVPSGDTIDSVDDEPVVPEEEDAAAAAPRDGGAPTIGNEQSINNPILNRLEKRNGDEGPSGLRRRVVEAAVDNAKGDNAEVVGINNPLIHAEGMVMT